MSRDGWILPIPQPKDVPYLYMPNPALVHKQSANLSHFLGLVDIYILLNQPEVYDVEPYITNEYRPDVSCILDFVPVLVELQRSVVANKKIQEKVDNFVAAYDEGAHKAKTLLIITDYRYNLDAPQGFHIVQKKMDIL